MIIKIDISVGMEVAIHLYVCFNKWIYIYIYDK